MSGMLDLFRSHSPINKIEFCFTGKNKINKLTVETLTYCSYYKNLYTQNNNIYFDKFNIS